MLPLIHAVVVGMLLATGTYMLLQRSAIRLILGLGLLTHGVNLLLFSTGGLQRGIPPIVEDKAAFQGDISAFVDPLPQALILTAIVISFGVTAFIVVLFNQRNAIISDTDQMLPNDPFAPESDSPRPEQPPEDDYEYLEYTLADEYRREHPE
ncbi:MAG: NADH-quinone oxidoreductase subunit K [Caldilineaceae bacterium]|nr:NADH-quinone oxidoreductase subunit K [Caldilineaceae bacterium]